MFNALKARMGRVDRWLTIAEEQIALYKQRFPLQHDRLDAAFQHLCAPVSLRELSEDVYRSHVRELLLRAANGADLRPATKAECLAALSAMSLTAPLTQDYSALMARLFNWIMKRTDPENTWTLESYPGACDEILVEMRKRLRDETRR